MKKYNLSNIMKRAWEIKKQKLKNIFSICLRMAWKEAKEGVIMKEEIKRLVETYRIQEREAGVIRVMDINKAQASDDLKMIKENKQAILDYIRNEKRAANERQHKIDSIEGLSEIEACMDAWAEWHADFDTMVETGRGYMTVKKPSTEVAELRKKYPVADAYLIADKESRRSNHELATIGKNALERIINGEDYKKVLDDMKKERAAFTESHIWD